MHYHQGQSTLPRLLVLLRPMGVAVSQRQLQRLLTEKHDSFIAVALWEFELSLHDRKHTNQGMGIR